MMKEKGEHIPGKKYIYIAGIDPFQEDHLQTPPLIFLKKRGSGSTIFVKKVNETNRARQFKRDIQKLAKYYGYVPWWKRLLKNFMKGFFR